ncbi:MAG: DNA polymerase III subunit delta' [Novosphingobium sp.]
MNLIGHDPAWAEWRAALASTRMHHGWLLAGPRGVGKGSFARAAAAELVAESGIPQPGAGAHPDILLLDPQPQDEDEARKRDEGKPFKLRRNITVDDIRRMQRRLTTRPTLGARRAVIVDPADELEKGAANALLKSLEEPPAGTFFLLVAHHPGRLPATLHSRCRRLRFDRLADSEIDTVLREYAPEADRGSRAAAIVAARGSPGEALHFIARDLGKLHALMRELLATGDRDLALRGALAGEMGARPDRDRLLAALDLARATLAAALADAGAEQQLRIIEAHARITRLSAQAPTFNFDPGLLIMEIGGLLASAALPTQAATRA